MVDPKLHHVLIVLSYPLLLLFSLMQAAPGTPAPSIQEGRVGTVHLQLAAVGAPLAGRRFELIITLPAHGARVQLEGAVLVPAPTSPGAGSKSREPLALFPRTGGGLGVYEASVRPLVAGWWSLVLVGREGRGIVSATIPLKVEALPPLPAWLEWRIALLTLALLVYAVWVHNRRDALDRCVSASAVAFEERRC